MVNCSGSGMSTNPAIKDIFGAPADREMTVKV